MKPRCFQSSISRERLLAHPPLPPCIVKSEMMFHEKGHGNPGTSVKACLCSRHPTTSKPHLTKRAKPSRHKRVCLEKTYFFLRPTDFCTTPPAPSSISS